VEKLGPSLYRCKVCATIVNAPADFAPPLVHLATSSGGPMYRVVTMSGITVHQCLFPPPDPWHDAPQPADQAPRTSSADT
jgi:hypothetical protein